MSTNPKTIAAHLTRHNVDFWSDFLFLARERGLSNSVALEYAARTWMRDQGDWSHVLADPAPDTTTRIRPHQKGDFEPFDVPWEVAAFVDRWQNPPMVVTEGLDPFPAQRHVDVPE